MNYYRRYVGDYMRDTAHLSILEHGAYNLMLDHCYATEKPLPGTLDGLYRLCRAMSRSEQEAVRNVAREFFELRDDGYHNPRADREVGVAQTTIGKQRTAGAQAAAKRWSSDGSTHLTSNESGNESTDRSTHKSSDRSAIQPPTTNHHPPSPSLQPPSANQTVTAGADAPPLPAKRTANGEKPPAKSAAIKAAYCEAYRLRYGTDPVVDNSKSNALLCQVVDRLGAAEAPPVAAFYVRHNGAWYVKHMHQLDWLVRDAEKLRTEWATGTTMTDTKARQTDKTAANAGVWGGLIAEAEANERTIENER